MCSHPNGKDMEMGGMVGQGGGKGRDWSGPTHCSERKNKSKEGEWTRARYGSYDEDVEALAPPLDTP